MARPLNMQVSSRYLDIESEAERETVQCEVTTAYNVVRIYAYTSGDTAVSKSSRTVAEFSHVELIPPLVELISNFQANVISLLVEVFTPADPQSHLEVRCVLVVIVIQIKPVVSNTWKSEALIDLEFTEQHRCSDVAE